MKVLVKNKTLIFGLLKGVVAFFLVVFSFFHVFFERYSTEYLEHKKVLKKIALKRSLGNSELLNQHLSIIKQKYPNDEALHQEIEVLITDFKMFNEATQKEVKAYNTKKKEIVAKNSFRGRASFRFWLFVFGLVSALFYFACKSLIDEISKGSKFRHHLVSISGIIVSCFWFIHLMFYTQKDFNKNTYFFTILGIAILCSGFTYFLVKYYTYKDQVIYKLISLVDRIKSNHYQRAAVKAMYSEKNDVAMLATDTIKENIKEFDKDVAETLKGI